MLVFRVLLPVIAITATTVSFKIGSAKAIRRYGLVSAPLWLIYNIINVAIGAVVCEVLTLCPIFIGMERYDKNK